MTDRIKLAEAMGWHKNPDSGSWSYRVNFPDVKYAHYEHELPDPENDANDDYAVLEWMRAQGGDYHHAIKFSALNYRIGDYARAALKVMNEQ